LKKTALVAAAAVAALALPTLALAQDGYVDASYRDIEGGGDALTVGGGVATEVGGVNLQFNANHTRADAGGANASTTQLAAHAYVQNEQYSIGGFVTGGDLAGNGAYGVGVAGSFYLDNLTLGAVVSHNAIDNGGGHYNTYGANVRYFFGENLAVGASYDNVDFSGGGDADVWGAEAEYKFASPVSVFASYQNVDVGGADADIWGLGARYYFGAQSLKEQERSGAKAQRNPVTLF